MDPPESEPEYSEQTDYQPFIENVSDHSDGEDRADEHLNLPQQQVEAEQTFEAQHHTQPSEGACAQSLCPPKDGADEKYLVEKDGEDPVKSKPHKSKMEQHRPPLSSSDTSDSDSSDRVKRKATVADHRSKSGSTSSSNHGSNYSGDVDTESESDISSFDTISLSELEDICDTHTIYGRKDHATLCKAISRPHKRGKKSYISLRILKLPKTGVTVSPVVNCRGDMNQRCATLEATVNFPRSRRFPVCMKILERVYSCKVKLTIAVYGGKTKEGSPLISTKSVEKVLKKEEREAGKMKIIVPEVVNMDVFVLPKKPEECPDLFCFEITALLEARKIEISTFCTEDSGCDGFVEVSTSVASAER